jgi:hypothetical protein
MKKIIFILLLITISNYSFGAAFNATDSLINIPIAKKYRTGEFSFGMSSAYSGSSSYRSNIKNAYEFDYKINMSLNRDLQLSLN